MGLSRAHGSPSAARLRGFQKDLKLTDTEYETVLRYAVCSLILNVLLTSAQHSLRWLHFDADTLVRDVQLLAGILGLTRVNRNMFLNYIGKPSIYLPVCMMVWGTISILTGTWSPLLGFSIRLTRCPLGVTHNYVGVLLTRFFLGFVEAAFFPGALFLLSKWYKRSELGQRTALLSVSGSGSLFNKVAHRSAAVW
jgi:MFS family permease